MEQNVEMVLEEAGGRRQEESSHKAFSLGSLRRRLLERGAPVSSWREGGARVCV